MAVALCLVANFTSNCCTTVNTLVATELRGPVDFDFKILRDATNKFDTANKLGEGGFGEVYKVSYNHYWYLIWVIDLGNI